MMQVPAPRLVSLPDRTVETVSLGDGDALIVLESGLGDDWSSWSPVLAPLAERARVLAYSRPGYGQSSAVTTPRDVFTEARELHEILQTLDRKSPRILVGHSLGGLIVQACAALDPSAVAGMVLVDAPHPDQIAYLNRDTSQAGEVYREHVVALTGVARQEHEALIAFAGRGSSLQPTLCNGRVILLYACLRSNVSEGYQNYRRGRARETVARYPNAELREVYCGHYIHRERPFAVLDAVDEVLARLRHERSFARVFEMPKE
jgi:pimeloyl-ACP methyl ester carboxylesterase